ncbi:MAG: hypothetical protein NC923_00425 [Candidatus Omnitrophica bacterium]|nr:hypothetical protein [Candidatus Omnitrophota bacterium]
MRRFKISILVTLCLLIYLSLPKAQEEELEFNIDASSPTVALPAIFKPNLDLSGRGFHRESLWPQTLAVKEALDAWQKEMGFSGLYRIQYNLWEIAQLSKDKNLQRRLLANYEDIFKRITDSGGTVILDLFGTPAGLGKILDKKSPPWDMQAFKAFVKGRIYDLSCVKKYNIWYEVWSAPDLDDFFLGRKQEYLLLYKVIAESIKELEAETKLHIPVGGPSASWWFQNVDGNTINSPEKSLIYELIRFCYSNRLPLDFISWHSYTSDPYADKENTVYRKTAVVLIRDWLGYFGFDRNTPLLITEWNYDRDANLLAERDEKSYINSSYIFSRLKNMWEAGIDNQIFFCLEDFKNNSEGIVRNIGVFSFDQEYSEYKGGPKPLCKAFRLLSLLGKDMFMVKTEDVFAGIIATKSQEGINILVYNYIDPEIAMSYIARNIALLSASQRQAVITLIKTGKLSNDSVSTQNLGLLRVSGPVKSMLKKAQDFANKALQFQSADRKLAINIKNFNGEYLREHYIIDASSSAGCDLVPLEKTELTVNDTLQEKLVLAPYSVHLLLFKKKPPEPKPAAIPENRDEKANLSPQNGTVEL